MIHLAVDDTDSRDGFCTTYLVNRILAAFPELDLVGLPRLVRLNPSVPWKTRGNGAVALTLSEGRGPHREAAWFAGSAHAAFDDGRDPELDLDEVLERAAAVVERHADVAGGAEPGLVVTRTPPPPALYRRGVTDIVPRRDALAALEAVGARWRGWNGGRGLVGAAAALAWSPGDATWELLAYRERPRWGTPRDVDPASLRQVATSFPSVFDAWDHANDEPVGVPRTPCPVLAGIRGDDPLVLPPALNLLAGEAWDEATLFLTNQGSDDHLVPRRAAGVLPRRGAVVRGRVAGGPRSIEGGHVLFPLEDATGRLACAAFEPTKGFRHRVLGLRPGDEVEVHGSVMTGPHGEATLHLEKLQVLAAPPGRVKVANPTCDACDRRMKSAGRDAGYRCPDCGARAPEDAARWRQEPRSIAPGWYEVPPRARRHLAKPLQRMGARSAAESSMTNLPLSPKR